MRLLLPVIALLVASCSAPFQSATAPDADDVALRTRLYPVSMHRLMEKSLETVETLPDWQLVHLDPDGGRIECRREDWRQEETVLLTFSATTPALSSMTIETTGEGLSGLSDEATALREFLAALERRIEVP